MKAFWKKMFTLVLLSGILFTIVGKTNATNHVSGDIDPGPAHIVTR